MSPAPELLRQGAQRRGDGFSIGFIAVTLRDAAFEPGAAVAARLGIAGDGIRSSVELAAGESAPLPGGGSIRLLEIFVSPDGSQSAAAVEISEPSGSKA